MKKLLLMIALLALVCLVVAACGKEIPVTTGESSDTTPSGTSGNTNDTTTKAPITTQPWGPLVPITNPSSPADTTEPEAPDTTLPDETDTPDTTKDPDPEEPDKPTNPVDPDPDKPNPDKPDDTRDSESDWGELRPIPPDKK